MGEDVGNMSKQEGHHQMKKEKVDPETLKIL